MIFVRGFGFVTYVDPGCMDKVLADGPHNIDGKKVRLLLYIIDQINIASIWNIPQYIKLFYL